jgi:pyruvate/2-oxoglutarate dehydrogenase complex dihydrolipoamide dehydrogenase (E3) component
VIDAYARFSGPDTIEADGETYRFTKGAVLAAGSDVALPPIAGIENVTVWDSDDIMELEELPESAIVMGGGAIGLELGLFLARMGCKTIQANRSRIFSKLDAELADEMQAVLESEPNMTLVAPFRATGIEEKDGQVHLHLETTDGPRTLVAKHFIAATGRSARIEDMGLEAAGVVFERGRVQCDAAMRTTNPRIFVAGDATGEDLLLHVANWEGKAAGKGAAEVPGDHAVERRLHMTAIFTDPPLATIGMTQMAAEAAGIPIVTASAKLAQTGRAITMDVQHGLWKMIAHKKTGELLGCQILGPRADDLIHIISTAMYYKGTAMDLLEMPWYHPTLAEVGLTLARNLVAQVEL